MASVSHIFICSSGKLPMQEVPRATVIAHVGLAGDRYAAKRGTFSKGDDPRDVTLISARDIAHSNAQLETPYTLAETRRNLVIDGDVQLLDLIGKEFAVGEVRLRGIEEAAPCTHPQRLAQKPGFARAFEGRAGIRAEFLTDGTIAVGDVLREEPQEDRLISKAARG